MTAALTFTTTLSDHDLISTISAANEEMSRQHALFLLNLAEFDDRGLAGECGARSTAAWIVRSFDVADNTAYDYLRVARTVSTFRFVADSFLEAKINYSKVRLLGKYLTDENEIELVLLAESMSYRELEQALAGRDRAGDGRRSGGEDQFRLWVDKETGRVRFSGELGPVEGQKLLTALKIGELANLVDLGELDPELLADGERLDEALAEAESDEPDEAAEPGSSRFGMPMPAKLMSAFLGVLNIVHSSPTNSRRAPGAQVHVIYTEDGHAHLPHAPAATAESLTGTVLNGYMRGHLLDSKGSTMKLGRSRRLVSDAVATAVLAEWMFRCAMPGCPHTQFIEFHHIVEWSRGGLTNPENLLPLCSHCHSLVTRGTVRVQPDPHDPARLMFYFRDGTVFESMNRSLPLRVACAGEPYTGAEIPEPPILINQDFDEAGWISFDA